MPVVRTDGLSVSRSVGHVISKSREARAWSSAITVWKQFITWHKLYLRWLWHAAQKRTFRSALLTLKIWQYHDPGVTKPVLCPFLNQWIIRTFGFWCESVGPSWVWFASDKSKCDRVVRSKTSMPVRVSATSSLSNGVCTILTLNRMDFDAIFQQINPNLCRKLYALTYGLQNGLTKTSLPESFAWRLLYPNEPLAILCESCCQKSIFFLPRRNFPPYIRGDF